MSQDPNPYGAPAPSSEPVYEHEIEFLLDTIKDYTNQLRVQIDKSDSSIQYTVIIGYASAFLAYVSAAMTESITSKSRSVLGFSGDIGAVFAIGFVAVIVLIFIQQAIRFQRTRNDRRRLAMILTNLVRRGSQFRDRGSIPFSKRVMLDIILSDAEVLIDRANAPFAGLSVKMR